MAPNKKFAGIFIFLVAFVVASSLVISQANPAAVLGFWAKNGNDIYNTNQGNVGINTQTPQAKLDVNGTATIKGTLGVGTSFPTQKLDVVGFVKGQSGLCISDDCRTSWPSSGGGTVTSIISGFGIILSPNPITTTGSVSVDTSSIQRRVSSACDPKKAIRIINSDGTVTCENIPSFLNCAWNGQLYSPGSVVISSCGCAGGCQFTSGIRYTCGSDGTWSPGGCGCVTSCPIY